MNVTGDHLVTTATAGGAILLNTEINTLTSTSEGDAPAIYILLMGELSLEPVGGGEPAFAKAGDSIGVHETLGGAESTGWKAHVTRGGVALRVEREALFDLLADHIDVLQGLFSALRRRQVAVAPA